MAAERYDIKIDQGATFELEVDLFDEDDNPDQANYTVAAMIKKSYTSNTIAYAFDCSLDGGLLTISMSAADTANTVPGRYVYDVKLSLSANGWSDRIMEGVVTITPGVTT